MYYFSFDETGDFENTKGKRDRFPLIIAGLVFEGDEEEIKNERKRIKAYYSAVCDGEGCSFPEDLHVDGKAGNNNAVGKVKAIIAKTLSGFLCDNDYPGKDTLPESVQRRIGTYYTFAYVKGKDWKGNRRRIPSWIADDEKAGNLYMHMAQDVIGRVIFHNPYFPQKKTVSIDIPTRRFVYNKTSEGYSKDRIGVYKSQFIKFGYKKGKYADDDDHDEERLDFELGAKNDYRIAIEREILSGDNEADIEEFKVRSIKYDSNASEGMEFLYLTDSINSVLSFKFPEKVNQVEEVYKRLAPLAGAEHTILYSYDDLDTLYGKAVLSVEREDYFEAFSYLYDAEQINCESREYYKEHLIKELCDKICTSSTPDSFYTAIRKLSSFTYSNEVDRNKLCYLFEKMKVLGESRKKDVRSSREKKNLFYLYDAGVSVFTHLGDSKKANQYYKKCIEYKDYVDGTDLIILNNKMIVFLSDVFAFKKAYDLACENVDIAKAFGDFRITHFGMNKENGNVNLGIAYSQLGQVCAVCKKDLAEDVFKKALRLLASDEFNYKITLSYYLHFLIGERDEKKYRYWIKNYLGGKSDPEEQLRYIFLAGAKMKSADSRSINPEFALYVWVKGLYVFDMEISSSLESMLSDIDGMIVVNDMARGKGKKNHPWELIYKYLAFIMYGRGLADKADKYMAKVMEVNLGGEQIIKAIVTNTRLQYAKLTKDSETAHILLDELSTHIVSMNDNLGRHLIDKNDKEKYAYLSKILQYMYV